MYPYIHPSGHEKGQKDFLDILVVLSKNTNHISRLLVSRDLFVFASPRCVIDGARTLQPKNDTENVRSGLVHAERCAISPTFEQYFRRSSLLKSSSSGP